MAYTYNALPRHKRIKVGLSIASDDGLGHIVLETRQYDVRSAEDVVELVQIWTDLSSQEGTTAQLYAMS